ncbi:MAG: leucine-rich repeat domain-containing protein, partial [Lachnospiraceae bacterium]|nr:leucine-rich repeat domain-containing protein [Lachnospiraceae bacterium]
MKKHLLLTSLVTGLVVLAAVTKGTGPDTVFGSPVEDIPAEIVEADAPADDGIAPEAGSREEEVNGVLSGDENWSYVVNDNDEAVIIAYTGSDSYVTVPEEIDSRPVTSIRPTAFKGNLLIQKITMSGNIDTLWADSFAGCTNLASADLKGVKELGDGAFKNCGNLEYMTLYEGLTTIPESCFENCNKELRIYLPKSLSVIRANAFKNTMTEFFARILYAGTEEEWNKVTVSA